MPIRSKPHRRRAFDPRSVPGMRLWLEPSVLRGYLHGAEIAVWFDRSGVGNNAASSTAGARPTVDLSKSWPLGFGITALFDGNDRLALSNDTTGMPTSFFTVVRSTAAMAAGVTRSLLITHVHGWYQGGLDPGTPTLWGMYENTASMGSDAFPVTDPPYVMTAVCRAFNDVDFLTNGGSKVTRTNMASGQSRGATALGADPTGVQFLNGSMPEVIWFDRAVTKSERRAIEEYLHRRYVNPPAFSINVMPD